MISGYKNVYIYYNFSLFVDNFYIQSFTYRHNPFFHIQVRRDYNQMRDYALQQQSQESQGLQYVDRYFGKKRTSNFVCLYRPVKHVPISYQSYCLNSQELMKQQIQLKKMERRFQKFKKLLKVINDRVGLDTSYFFDDQEDSLLGEQTQANFDTKSFVSTKIKREDALRKRNQIVQRYYEALRSGINISRFCEINNLAQRTLRRWLNKK